MKNPLFVNKKVWRAFSSQELEEYKQKVYDFYKSHGFPYYDMDEIQMSRVVNNLFDFEDPKVFLK